MQIIQRAAVPTNQVTALFDYSALSFDLADGVTFAELADRLDQLGSGHSGLPTAIYFRFGMSRRPVFHSQTGL